MNIQDKTFRLIQPPSLSNISVTFNTIAAFHGSHRFMLFNLDNNGNIIITDWESLGFYENCVVFISGLPHLVIGTINNNPSTEHYYDYCNTFTNMVFYTNGSVNQGFTLFLANGLYTVNNYIAQPQIIQNQNVTVTLVSTLPSINTYALSFFVTDHNSDKEFHTIYKAQDVIWIKKLCNLNSGLLAFI